MSWRWLTLTWVTPHYHQRKEVSLLSSGRDQVVHSCYCRQHNCYGLVRVLFNCLFTVCALLCTKWVINRYIWVNLRCSILLSFSTKSRSIISDCLVLNRFQLNTTTVWVLYSQASRAISIGQLHASLHFHIQPINVVVFNGSLEDIKS